MKFLAAFLTAVAVLSSEVRSSDLLQTVQLKLDELFVERSEQFEQLLTELYRLRQSVENVAWLTNRVERAVQKVQADTDVLTRNVTLLTSQTDDIILNQRYCANHEALKNLFFDLTPKCLGTQTVRPPPIPSTPTTSVATEATTISPCTTTTEVTTIAPTQRTTIAATVTSTTIPSTSDDLSGDYPNVYDTCSRAPPRSGLYWLRRPGGGLFRAFCEQERFGGGLLVFQRRQDGSVNFNRSWSEFVAGFGSERGEFWLGLEWLHRVAPNATELVVTMKNYTGVEAYERYSNFWVDSSTSNYRVTLARGSGTAGDSLYSYFFEQFMTYDHVSNENYRECIAELGSAFWHYSCNSQIERNNLNGIYGLGKGKQGIWWGTFGNLSVQNTSPLKEVQMMVRY